VTPKKMQGSIFRFRRKRKEGGRASFFLLKEKKKKGTPTKKKSDVDSFKIGKKNLLIFLGKRKKTFMKRERKRHLCL